MSQIIKEFILFSQQMLQPANLQKQAIARVKHLESLSAIMDNMSGNFSKPADSSIQQALASANLILERINQKVLFIADISKELGENALTSATTLKLQTQIQSIEEELNAIEKLNDTINAKIPRAPSPQRVSPRPMAVHVREVTMQPVNSQQYQEDLLRVATQLVSILSNTHYWSEKTRFKGGVIAPIQPLKVDPKAKDKKVPDHIAEIQTEFLNFKRQYPNWNTEWRVAKELIEFLNRALIKSMPEKAVEVKPNFFSLSLRTSFTDKFYQLLGTLNTRPDLFSLCKDKIAAFESEMEQGPALRTEMSP